MSYRPHGRAQVSSSWPRAWATCDRCGCNTNLYRLNWQFDYRGPQIQNLRILVCERCEDKVQPQLKPVILPPDPVPVLNARPEPYTTDETDYRVTQDDEFRITQEDDPRITESGDY